MQRNLEISLQHARQFQDMRQDNPYMRNYLEATSTNTYSFDSKRINLTKDEAIDFLDELTEYLTKRNIEFYLNK